MFTAALLYLSALTISGSQCSCLCIQPDVPAVKDGWPLAVAWVGDALQVERLGEPSGAANLVHADVDAELLG